MNVQALHHRLTDRHARVERGVWVLKNDLHIAPCDLELAWLHRENISSFELHGAASRFDQPQHGPSHRGLAATRFTHQPKRFAFSDEETDIIHRFYVVDNTLKQACAHGEIFHQIVDFDQDFPFVIVVCLHVECSRKGGD